VGEVLEADRGIKIFAGPRTDSFFNFLPFPITLASALNEGFFPDLAALFPPAESPTLLRGRADPCADGHARW
jgi:hypothetical protein